MQDSEGDIATLSTASSAGATVALGAQGLLKMYCQMVLCRTLDERVWLMNRQGKAAIVASAQGHEAGQIGSVWALRKGQTTFTSTTVIWPY